MTEPPPFLAHALCEYSLVIIKPDGTLEDKAVHVLARILHEIEGTHILISDIVDRLDESVLRGHYAHLLKLEDKQIFSKVLAYMQSGPVWVAVVEGREGVVQGIREILGNTDPRKARPGTVRHEFGNVLEGGDFRNVAHASGTPEEALDEIRRFFSREAIERKRPELAERIWGEAKRSCVQM